METKTMLVGTDFSESSVWAAQHSSEYAKKLGYNIHLVYVVDPKHPDPKDEFTLPEDRLEEMATDIAGKTGVTVDSDVYEGDPWKILSKIAGKEQYAMVAVGYSGSSGFLSRIGSVASKTVRTVDKPILVMIPSHHNDGSILGCIDFSDQTEKVNYWTHNIADLTDSQTVFAHVAVPFEAIVAATPGTGGLILSETVLSRFGGSEEGYKIRLEASVRHRLGIETENEVAILFDRSPSHAISELAREKNASLVVLGRHGHNTLGARITGSTAEHIMNQSHSSVLVLP